MDIHYRLPQEQNSVRNVGWPWRPNCSVFIAEYFGWDWPWYINVNSIPSVLLPSKKTRHLNQNDFRVSYFCVTFAKNGSNILQSVNHENIPRIVMGVQIAHSANPNNLLDRLSLPVHCLCQYVTSSRCGNEHLTVAYQRSHLKRFNLSVNVWFITITWN